MVLARLLRQAGRGTLLALEHDEHWVARVTGLLEREHLGDIARVVHAPLEGDPPWYSRAALSHVPDTIDLLLVDGPPAYEPGHELRREPALGAFDTQLTADATVVLDDVDRAGEQQVLADWQRRLSWTFVVDDRAGVAVGARR